MLLGVLTRGTSLAIGIGILYALVIEGLLSAFADSVSVLEPLDGGLPARQRLLARGRARRLRRSRSQSNGPGAYSGPIVGGLQAAAVLAGFIAGLVALTGLLLRRRDVP